MGTLRKAERFKAALCWGVVRCVLLVAAVLGVAGVSSGAPAAVSNDKKYSCIRVNVIGMPNSGEVQSRKVPFPPPAFSVPPRILLSVGNADSGAKKDILYFRMHKDGALGQHYQYRVPRMFTAQARSVTETGFFLDYSAQPAAAVSMETNPVYDRADDDTVWPGILKLCYMAWEPGSWVDGGDVREGSGELTALGSSMFMTSSILFNPPFSSMGAVPQVVATIKSDGSVVKPVSMMVSEITNTGFNVRAKLQSGGRSFQSTDALEIDWVASAGSLSPGFPVPSPLPPGELIIHYIVNTGPHELGCFYGQSPSVWGEYEDEHNVRIMRKLYKIPSQPNTFSLRITKPSAYVRFHLGAHRTNSPRSKFCSDPRSNPPCPQSKLNATFPSCGYDFPSAGFWKLQHLTKNEGPVLVSPAPPGCTLHCSGHGQCRNNKTCSCNENYVGFGCESLFNDVRPNFFSRTISTRKVWQSTVSRDLDAPCFKDDTYQSPDAGPAVVFAMNLTSYNANNDVKDVFQNFPLSCTLSSDKAFTSDSSFVVIDTDIDLNAVPQISLSVAQDPKGFPDLLQFDPTTAPCDWGDMYLTISCLKWLPVFNFNCPGESKGSEGDKTVCSGHGYCVPCPSGKHDCYTCDCFDGYAKNSNETCTECAGGYIETPEGKCLHCPGMTNPCNDHGECILSNATGSDKYEAICDCQESWVGKDCSQCMLCNGHGQCGNTSSSEPCICDTLWTGVHCTTCIDGYFEKNMLCKTCNQDCTAATNGVCSNRTGAIKCECIDDSVSWPHCVGSTSAGTKWSTLALVGVTLGATLVFVSLVWLGRSLFTKYNEIYYYKQHRLELSRELLIDQSAADGLLNNTNGFGTNALDWTIRYDLLTIGETIGTGSAGTVHKGKYLGENVAIKRISQGNKWDRESFFENFRRETSILSHLHHPNIVRFYGVSFLPSSSNSSDGGSFFIVTELCSHSLGHVLAANSYSRNEKLNIAIQIAHGIQALHSKKIIHRDLKPDNVLIDKNGNAKLADFGVAKQSQMSKKNPRSSKVAATVAVGTPIYMAPELALSTVAPTPKADIFSYGIMLNAIFAGEEPYAAETSGMNPFMLMGRIGQGKRPDLAPDLDNEIVDLLQLCWSENPNDRPSVAQVLKVLKRLV